MTTERINWTERVPFEIRGPYFQWLDAIEKADNRDTAPLIGFLYSDLVLGPDARDHLANLLSRHDLRRKKGGQAIPSYRMPKGRAKQERSAALVEYWRTTKGMTVADAIAATLRDEKREELRLAYEAGDETIRAHLTVFDSTDPHANDEELDAMIYEKEIARVENFIKGGKSRRKKA